MDIKQVHRIDSDGLYVEPVIMTYDELNNFTDENPLPSDIVLIDIPEGFYLPKWNGEEWVEGGGLSLDEIKAQKISELDQTCNQTILSGFTSSALGDPHEYDFDYEAQQNLAGMLSLFNADATITDVTWKTKDAGPLVHTKEQFLQLYKDGFDFKNSNIGKYWTLKAQVLSAGDKAGVDSVTW
jgi:hypothetical protein